MYSSSSLCKRVRVNIKSPLFLLRNERNGTNLASSMSIITGRNCNGNRNRNSNLNRNLNLNQMRGFSTKSVVGGEMIPGRADRHATERFIARSGLPMYHQFDHSGLFINPIIHGPPSRYHKSDKEVDEKTETLIHAMSMRAVHLNRSNCLVVYQHNHNIYTGKPWSLPSFSSILNGGPEPILREELVVIADLGVCHSKEDVLERLHEACRLNGLGQIDCAYIEVTDHYMKATGTSFPLVIDTLQELCNDGKLSFFGIQISCAPYIYHNPAFKSAGEFTMLPCYIEEQIRYKNIAFCDLVIYQISPSTACPATFPMLDPATDQYDPQAQEGDIIHNEQNRKLTRGALDPLVCFRGRGKGLVKPEQEHLEDKEHLEKMHDDMNKRAEVSAASDPSEEIEREELREFNRTQTPYTAKELEEVRDLGMKAHEAVAGGHRLEVYLAEGAISKPLGESISKAFDYICPALKSTPHLQDKALRIIFSTGVEVMMIDSELSAMIGKLKIKPKDLVTLDETEELFTQFVVPFL